MRGKQKQAITISKLVKQLRRLHNAHGDLKVVIGDHFEGYHMFTEGSVALRRLDSKQVKQIRPTANSQNGEVHLTLNQNEFFPIEHTLKRGASLCD